MIKNNNSLADVYPNLAKEWHPTKNGDLTPEMVTPDSDKIVWWCVSYDDEKTGKHFDFEWAASIANRSNGMGCPFVFDNEALKSDFFAKWKSVV